MALLHTRSPRSSIATESTVHCMSHSAAGLIETVFACCMPCILHSIHCATCTHNNTDCLKLQNTEPAKVQELRVYLPQGQSQPQLQLRPAPPFMTSNRQLRPQTHTTMQILPPAMAQRLTYHQFFQAARVCSISSNHPHHTPISPESAEALWQPQLAHAA